MTSSTAMSDNTTNGEPPFSEHRVPRGQGSIYARDYKGTGSPFVLMHGFPDNLHIYGDLVPYLVAGGRRVVAFDFLGFGASEKPSGATYSFKQKAYYASFLAPIINNNLRVNQAPERLSLR